MEDGINISNYCTYDGGVQIMISSSKSDKVKLTDLKFSLIMLWTLAMRLAPKIVMLPR